MNTVKDSLTKLLNSIKLGKINFLNHKIKKYIIKYEEVGNNLKIYNSNGDVKVVKNNIPNKVKIMEIVKDHAKEIEKRINYYDSKKDDYEITILSSGFILAVLGILFLFSFFVGSYTLLIMTLLSFGITLYLFCSNTYNILLFREEIKRLKTIKEQNRVILDDNELKELFTDTLTIIKDKVYNVIMKIVNILDNKSKI